jgi:hypothetical protein
MLLHLLLQNFAQRLQKFRKCFTDGNPDGFVDRPKIKKWLY